MHYLFSLLVTFAVAAVPLPEKGFDLKSEKTISYTPVKGQPTVVVFLSSKCPCSKSHEQHLQDLKEKFPEVNFIGIHSNSNETVAESTKHFQESPISFPILQDEKAKWANNWKALKTPHAYVLDAKGQVVYKGGVTSSPVFESSREFYLQDALTALKEHKPIQVSEGRTLGCFIER